MEQQLTAHQYPVNKILSSDYEFRIPRYQRPYSWQHEHALQLLDDLAAALESYAGEPYFLGSLVLVAQGNRVHDVIDGQQRLTTVTILLAVIRDLSDSESYARSVDKLVLEPGDEVSGLSPRPRLKLREQDAGFFAEHIQKMGATAGLAAVTDQSASTEAQRNIRKNGLVLRDRLSTWDEARRRELAKLISTQTFLVVVSTPEIASAYRIFSVMNARGLDLSPTDIFKSRVIGGLGDDALHSKRWEDEEQALGRDAFTDLFRDMRTIVSGERARRELLKEFPEQVLDTYLKEDRAAEFVDDLLVPYARAADAIATADAGPGFGWAAVNQWLQRLSWVDNKDWRPAALWAIRHHRDEPEFLVSYLKRLERLAASMLLREEYATPRVGRYLDLLKEVKAGEDLDAPSFDLTDEEKRLTRQALDGEIYRMQSQRARYVLLRLDELLSKTPGATYQHNIISIEHVLPRHPAEDSAWVQLFSEKDREKWTHRLGNLLLLNKRKNSQAGRFDFSDKKARYFSTSTGSAVFALTTQVLSHETWTPTVVEQRQQELTAVLRKEWDLN